MPAVLAWFAANVLVPIGEYFVALEVPKLFAWIKGLFKTQAQKADQAAALAEQKTAIDSGDLDKIAKAGDDVLNGTNPNP